MKRNLHIKRILSAFAAALLLSVLFCASSCGERSEVSKQALEYLENKYEKETFELSEVPKTKSVTGRYEIEARSGDDGIDFDVYVYAFFITDSYSVTKANKSAGEKIGSLLSPETAGLISGMTVYPIYDDGGTDYRFTSLPLDIDAAPTEIDSILLNVSDDTDVAAEAVKSIIVQLDAGGLKLERVRFVFDRDGYTVRIDAEPEYILSLDDAAVKELICRKVDGALTEAREAEGIFAERSVRVSVDLASEDAPGDGTAEADNKR